MTRHIASVAIGIAAALTLAGCAAPAAKPTPKLTLMERAIKKCDLTSDTSGLTLGDGNHTLILDGKGKKDYAGIEYA